MIPQYAPNHASPDEDIFARTQRILEAARAVQATADARPMTMNFPINMAMQPIMQQPQAQKMQPVVTKPQMTAAAPTMTAAPTPIMPHRVSVVENISPIDAVQVQQAKRRASWLALSRAAIAASTTVSPPAAKKARVEVAQAAPIKKQQPKKLPMNNNTTTTTTSTTTKKDTAAAAAAAAAAAPKDDKPKRPLSAYNLFFRHERAVILMHEARNPATSKDELLGDAVPVNRLPGQTPAQHRASIESVLGDNPFHQDRKTRAHRKTHGKIGFTELVKLVAARWRRADDETKALYDDLSAEEKRKYTVAYEAWRARQPQDVLDKLDSKKSGGKKSGGSSNRSPSPTSEPKKASPPTKKAILAKAAASDLSCFAPMPSLEPISDHDDFALLSDDELSAEDMDDLFPMPELARGRASFGLGVTGGVPTIAGGFDVAPLHGMAGIDAFPLDDSLVNFLTEFD